MKTTVAEPCIIMGDFNEVMEPSERRGAEENQADWSFKGKRELAQGELQKFEELMSILSQHYPQQEQDDIVLWQGGSINLHLL